MVATGIDTIAVTFPVIAHAEKAPSLRGVAVGMPNERWYSSRRWDLACGGWVSVNRAMRGRLELSVPRRAFGNNLRPVAVPQLMPVLLDAFQEVQEVMSIDTVALHAEQLAVSRLDLAHDFFDVTAVGTVLSALRTVPQRVGADVDLWASSGDPSPGSLVVRVKTAYRAQLYDKTRESGGGLANGQLRFEVQLKAARLGQCSFSKSCGGPVHTVSDLTDDKIEVMARTMFEEVGFNRAVLSRNDLLERIEKIDGLTDGDKAGLSLHLLWLGAGLRPPTSPRTFQKYEALARRHGMTTGDESTAGAMRLDWASSSQVRSLDW